MKISIAFCLALVIFCISSNAQQSITKIEDFAAMAGCWERGDRAKGSLVTEVWMKPAGNSILGIGRTVRNGKTVDHEFMRIEQRADGIYFVAKPKTNPAETDFKLKSSTAGEAVFENLAHDFPQRVIYKFTGSKLAGRIEGTRNGKSSGIDFPFERADCT